MTRKPRRTLKGPRKQPLRESTPRAAYNRERRQANKQHKSEKAAIRQQYQSTPRVRKSRRSKADDDIIIAVIAVSISVTWWTLKNLFLGIKWIIKFAHGKWVSRNAIQIVREPQS